MDRQRVLVAAGLAGLVAWAVWGFAVDVRVADEARGQVASRSLMIFWWAVRVGLPLLTLGFGAAAAVAVYRGRSPRVTSVVVLLLLLLPLVVRGFPLRWGSLPYYLLAAVYLAVVVRAYAQPVLES